MILAGKRRPPGRVIVLLAVLMLCGLRSRAAGKLPAGVVIYWDADRPSPGWRDCKWQSGGTGRTHYDREVRKHGLASLRIEGMPDEEIYVSSCCLNAFVDTEKTYVLRFWTRCEGVEGTACCQILAHRKVDEQHTKAIGWVQLDGKSAYPIAVSSEWVQHEIPVARFPGETYKVFLYFRVRGTSRLWVDEVSLVEKGVTILPGGEVPLSDDDYAGIRLPADALPENLVQNPGFEEGLDHWRVSGEINHFEVVADQGIDSSNCLRVTAIEFAHGWVWQRISIDPRFSYRFSYMATCRDFVGYLHTKVLPFDRHGRPLGWNGAEILTTGTTDGWEERSGEFSFSPGTKEVTIYLRAEDAIGTMLVDDVVFRPIPREQ